MMLKCLRTFAEPAIINQKFQFTNIDNDIKPVS